MDKMCYLDKVYVDKDDTIKFYQITLSDSLFREVKEVIVDKPNLLKFLNDSTLIKDFSLEDDYLKCDTKARLFSTSVIEQNLMKMKNKNVNSEHSFYEFLDLALENEYIILDDSILECEKYKGTAFSKFKHIKFSQSTMSTYFILYGSDGIYNKPIIFMDNGILKFVPFHFGVPAGNAVSKDAQYVKDIIINNEQYYVYRVNELGIYPSEVCTSASLINKASTNSEIQKCVINVMKDYIRILNNTLGAREDTVNWAGGNSSYESQYGIILQNSLKQPGSERRNELITMVFNDYLGVYSYEEAVKIVKENTYFSMCEKVALQLLLFVVFNSSNPTECLALAQEVKEKFTREKMYSDLFLYRVRVGCYVNSIRLTDVLKPYLIGSEFGTVTTVNAGYYYGDVDSGMTLMEEF